jgi:hypothetical protein
MTLSVLWSDDGDGKKDVLAFPYEQMGIERPTESIHRSAIFEE